MVHGVWDRLDESLTRPDVLVAIWPNEGEDRHERPVCLNAGTWNATELVDGEIRQVPCIPGVLAMMRMMLSGAEDGVALYEVPIGEPGGDGQFRLPGIVVCDAVVGLVPVSCERMRELAPARVAVRISPQGGAAEDTVLTVRPSDEVVPLWRGRTMVPILNAAFFQRRRGGQRFDMQLLRRLRGDDERPCVRVRVLCACFKTISRHRLALAPTVCLDDGERLAKSNIHAVNTATPPLPPLLLPDLRAAIIDAGSKVRCRERTRVFGKDLVEAAWHPVRIAAWRGMLDT